MHQYFRGREGLSVADAAVACMAVIEAWSPQPRRFLCREKLSRADDAVAFMALYRAGLSSATEISLQLRMFLQFEGIQVGVHLPLKLWQIFAFSK